MSNENQRERDVLLQPRVGRLSDTASAHLDFFRGTASLAVLIAHWRMLFFLDGSRVTHLNISQYFFYWITKLGHQAVVVFFVLSGFLVGRTVLGPMQSGKWSARRYWLRRWTRLEVVLLPSLALCWALDWLGSHIFPASSVYLNTAGLVVMPYDVTQMHGLKILFGNIMFLQTILVHQFGSNEPLWSLSNEFWYYVLFPLMVLIIAVGTRGYNRLLSLVGFTAVFIFLWVHPGRAILAGYLVWLAGAVISVLPPPRYSQRSRARILFTSSLLLLLLLGIYLPTPMAAWLRNDLFLGVLFSVLLYYCLHSQSEVSQRYRSVTKYTAQMSYTLYLGHMPLLVLFAACIGHRWQPDIKHIALAIPFLLIAFLYARCVYFLFEKRTDVVRKWLEARMGLVSPLTQDSFHPRSEFLA